MAGRNRRSKDRNPSSSFMGEKSFFSVMNIFKLSASKKPRDKEDRAQHEPVHPRKVRPRDDDPGRYVGEPDIDNKASAFIAKFYETRVMDSERQTVANQFPTIHYPQ